MAIRGKKIYLYVPSVSSRQRHWDVIKEPPPYIHLHSRSCSCTFLNISKTIRAKGAKMAPHQQIDMDLLVSVASDIGSFLINDKGEKRYQRSDDCLGALSASFKN